jgi:hypothetical protein
VGDRSGSLPRGRRRRAARCDLQQVLLRDASHRDSAAQRGDRHPELLSRRRQNRVGGEQLDELGRQRVRREQGVLTEPGGFVDGDPELRRGLVRRADRVRDHVRSASDEHGEDNDRSPQ